MSVAWHGRLFGNANDRPAVLDLATGADLPASQVTPILVNEYFAVASPDGHALVAYPITG